MKTGGTEMQTLRQVESLVAGGYHCVTVCYFEYDYTTVELFKRAGSEVVCLSAYGNRPVGRRAIYRFLKTGLKRVVNEYKPTIAHVQYMNPGAMPIWLLHNIGVKKILATSHTNADIYRSLKLIHFLQRHILKAFICVTENAERSFFGSSSLFDENFNLGKHNHFTIPNCLAPNIEFNNQARKKAPRNIGFVAQLKPIKGADIVMPAFAKVLEHYPDCQLMIAGDGELRKEMERQQHNLNIADNKVCWYGYVEHWKLQELYREMDIVWVPSRSEGFGLSAIEAMAQGCAVVSSAVGGLTEIIHDGEDGILFRPENTEDLAVKTTSLISNTQQYSQLSEAAIENARRYSFPTYQSRLLQLYSIL